MVCATSSDLCPRNVARSTGRCRILPEDCPFCAVVDKSDTSVVHVDDIGRSAVDIPRRWCNRDVVRRSIAFSIHDEKELLGHSGWEVYRNRTRNRQVCDHDAIVRRAHRDRRTRRDPHREFLEVYRLGVIRQSRQKTRQR